MSWSERWTELLHKLGYESQLRRGRSYARRGLVSALEVQMGRVTAQVEDSDRGPCEVEILVNRFDDQTWNQIMDALSSQAIYAAQLLAGDLPPSIEDLFQTVGVTLLPGGHYDIEIECRVCEDWEQPCKHTAAVLYLLGQMLDDDPWLLFRLRGRDRQQVLQALRQRRSDGEELKSAAVPDQDTARSPVVGSLNAEQAMPLSAQMETYWGTSRKLSDLRHHIAAPPIKLALLRRLGRPPFPRDSLETYDRLAKIYEEITEKALDLAYAPEPDNDEAS